MENIPESKLLKRITVNSQVMVGKPTVRGTRLTVEQVLKSMATGMSFDELKADYPFLEPEDLHACAGSREIYLPRQ